MRCGRLLAILSLGVAGCRAILGIDDAPNVIAAEDAAAMDAAGPDAHAGPRFCATAPPETILCDDFDDDDRPIEAAWDNAAGSIDLGISGNATITEDRHLFFSGTRAVAFDLAPLVSTDAQAAALLIKDLTTTADTLVIQARLRIVTEQFLRGGGGRVSLLYASFLPAGSVSIMRDEKGTALWVSDANPIVNHIYPFVSHDLVVGQWAQIVIAIGNKHPADDAGAGRIEVLLDGIPVGSAPLPAAFRATDARQEVDIGPLARGPMDGFRLNVDDVLIATTR